MELAWQRPDSAFFVRRCGANAITVVDRDLSCSFLLAPDRVVEAWPVASLAQLDAAAIDAILALEPALVLIGTGARGIQLAQAQLAAFLTRGVGVEAMDNGAAARTFNLLAGEGRKVVAAFILPDEIA